MFTETDLKVLVERVIRELGASAAPTKPATECAGPTCAADLVRGAVDPGEIPDIRAVDYRLEYHVPSPANGEEFARIKSRTWARLGQGRSGPRYRTQTQLRFWADAASAQDAVFSDVDPDLLSDMGLFEVRTRCESRDEYLTRPDLGAQFDPEAISVIKQRCQARPQVQIYVSDGLSSTAIEANVRDLLPAITQGLEASGIRCGTPFFVKYGRVRSMEPISEALDAEVICVLIGERPGLATAESLSAYLAYRATVGMAEADRTCVSNIHREGTNPLEAGAHIADVIKAMLRQKASGLKLTLEE